MSSIITLTTDFGLADGYVAAMKGVILGINPEARLVDICHNIEPQSILQAAFVFSTAYTFFPKRTVHVVVVDPGVGTERRAIILKTPNAFFVAPDNGVLSYIIQQYLAEPPDEEAEYQQYISAAGGRLLKVALANEAEAVAITDNKYFRSPVSPTFHGRDIFAPVAAHLSLGVALEEFGERLTSLEMLLLHRPQKRADGSLVAHIIHIDNFGNLITDIKSDDLPGTGDVTVEVGGRTISGVSGTYAERRELMALVGSSGSLEIALRDGSAQSLLGVRLGDEVILRAVPPGGEWNT